MLVQVHEGKLQGVEKKSSFTGKQFCAFLGIPYAKPPVGELRFQPPSPIEKWDGIRDASEEGGMCLQINMMHGRPITMGTEDCLYLNVYTPEAPSKIEKKKPVMVFVHGGGFCTGSGSPKMYGMDYLLDHDVVCVTLNYRLHVFGFLNTGTASCPGNAGLKDQLLALKWIKKNISNFGGDPENITLFGESAGAASVHLLMLSPLTKDLYHKVIIQSGSALCPWAIEEEPETQARNIAQLAGYEGHDLDGLVEYLKNQPAEKLCELANRCHEDAKLNTGRCSTVVFIPSVEKIKDGALIPDFPEKLIESALTVPAIVGYNDQEGLLMYLSQKPQCMASIVEDLSIAVKNNFHLDDSKQAELAAKIREFYFDNKDPTPQCTAKIVDLYTDLYFMKFYEAFDYLIESNAPTYIYLFTHDGKLNCIKNIIKMFVRDLNVKGAAHGDDLGYIFAQSLAPVEADETDKKVINHFSTLWTNFAKTGHPTSTLPNVDWKPHTSSQPCYLRIEEQLKVFNEKLYKERLGFWEKWSQKFRR